MTSRRPYGRTPCLQTPGSCVYVSCVGAAPLCIVADRTARHLSLVGELDVSTRPLVHSAAEDLLTRAPGGLTIDVARLLFVDAAGLGALLGLRTCVVEAGYPFVLRRPSVAVRRVFRLAGLDTLLPVAELEGLAQTALGEAQ